MPSTAISFLAHQGRERAEFLDDFLTQVKARQPKWRVGAGTWLPRFKAANSQDRLAGWSVVAAYGLADPEMSKMEVPYKDRGRGRGDFPYLKEMSPAANRKRFVDQVLEAQVMVGSEVLISPYLTHGISNTSHELSVSLDFANRAAGHPQAKGRQLLFGFEATEGVLANDAARNSMLNQLVELPEAPIYFRMRIRPPAGRKQYEERAPLKGLREVVEALTKNGRPVVLPRCGLKGWLMQGFGNVTFGAGNSASMQRNLTPGPGGGGGVPPLNWYFLPQFLGFVLAEELPQLRKVKGFVECGCPFCSASPPRPGAGFDAEAAGQHFLWWCAALADEVNAAGAVTKRATVVRRRLTDAQAFWTQVQAAGVQLDVRSMPTHLAVWTVVAA